jgi:hypothetical protein
MRLSQRLRGLVGRGTASEEVPTEPVALSAPPPPIPSPPAPVPVSAPATINLSVEAAYAMLHAFPKEAPEQQRLPALRTALSAMAIEKQKTLEQLLAEVLQEKARISQVVQNQDRQFEAQVLKISEAVDALWNKRDKLTEHHQHLALQAEERIEGLDQLIQCLSLTGEPAPAPISLTEMSVPKTEVVAEEDDGPVIIRMPRMELRPLGEDPAATPEAASEELSSEESEQPVNNRRKLYKMAS